MKQHASSESPNPGGAKFCTTHWTIVLAAGDPSAPNAQEALAELCRAYWHPVYVYVRRRGHASHDAEDLTQEFFARLLEKNYLEGLNRDGGKFRSFLLTAVKRFLANQWEYAQAKKRGGGVSIIRLDQHDAESRYRFEPSDSLTPEALFDRRWAFAVLERVMERLKAEHCAAGKAELFNRLQPLLSGKLDSVRYMEMAAGLELSEGALKVAVHRLRKRYGVLLREEIAKTVAKPEDIHEEIRYLISVAGSG